MAALYLTVTRHTGDVLELRGSLRQPGGGSERDIRREGLEPKARTFDTPGGHPGSGRRSQSRASSTPILRLGVLWEGSVRDPIRIPALAKSTQVGWPSYLTWSMRGTAA
jgi:hypothetical protein